MNSFVPQHHSSAIHRTMSAKTTGIKSAGFIQVLILIIVALILLRTLDIPIGKILSLPWLKDFAVTVKEMLGFVWQDIKEIFAFFLSVK